MQVSSFDLLGLSATFNVPVTSNEYNALCPKRGGDACCEDAVENSVYRGCGGKWRVAFLKAVAEETKVARTVVKQGPAKKDGTTSPIYESDGKYWKRVLSETGRTPESFQALANQFNHGGANEVKFDNTEREAGIAKARTARKEFREQVDRAIAGASLEVVRRNVGRFTSTDCSTLDNSALALALQKHYDAEASAKLAAQAAALQG